MVSRIKQLLDWQQLSPTQFADRIGIGRPVVSHILSERNKPSLDVVQRIIAAFPELSLPWLLSGTGDMLASANLVAAPGPGMPAVDLVPVAPLLNMPAAVPPAALANVLPRVAAAPLRPQAAVEQAVVATPVTPASPVAELKRPEVASAMAFRAAAAGRPVVSPRAATAQPPRFRPAGVADAGPGTAAAPVATGSVATTPATEVVVAAATTGAAADAGHPITGGPVYEAAPVAAPAAVKAGGQELMGEPVDPAGSLAGAAFAGLGEPGKAIRRIVIFYRDGSFADYQPES